MYDKLREARPKKLEKLRSAWAERAQNLRLQLRFWKKNIIGRAQGPSLSPSPLTRYLARTLYRGPRINMFYVHLTPN